MCVNRMNNNKKLFNSSASSLLSKSGISKRFDPSTPFIEYSLSRRPLHGIFAFSLAPYKFNENMISFIVFPMLCSSRLTLKAEETCISLLLQNATSYINTKKTFFAVDISEKE